MRYEAVLSLIGSAVTICTPSSSSSTSIPSGAGSSRPSPPGEGGDPRPAASRRRGVVAGPAANRPPLRDAGGEVAAFMPAFPLHRRWSAHLRNHRKLLIADGGKRSPEG